MPWSIISSAAGMMPAAMIWLMALVASSAESNTPNSGLAAFTEVVLDTADVMKSYAEMKARGVTFTREPFAATTDGSRVLYAANFKDPDGHILSITGWVSVR